MTTYGIKVEFNGKQNILLLPEGNINYMIGAMICELFRFDTRSLKNLLLKVESFHAAPNMERLKDAAGWIRVEMQKHYPPVICEMVYAEFMNYISEFYESNDKEFQEDFLESIVELSLGDMLSFLFTGTGYDNIGDETVGQLLLSLYLLIDMSFDWALKVFKSFLNIDNTQPYGKNEYLIDRMFQRNTFFQQIDYKILHHDDSFHSEYKIKTIMSLCIFEMAHIYETNAPIVRCKNCGQFFRPKKRSDTRYCSYPSPGDPNKTCKDIGAQIAWTAKSKTDDITREYRKIYMRYKMKTTRHPEDTDAQNKLAQLTDGMRNWRQKLETKQSQRAEFFQWLEQFNDKRKDKEAAK